MKILTDTPSLCDPKECLERGVIVIPACTIISDKPYRDIEDINTADFLKRIEDGEFATSSQPALGDILEAFD